MTAVRTPPQVAHWRAPANHPHDSAVIAAIARQLGKQPATVRDWISGHHQLGPVVATIVAALAAAGDHVRAERVLAPIRAAMAGIAAPKLTDGLLVQERTAAGDEDVALVGMLRHPSAGAARRLIHELDVDRTLNLELREAVAEEWTP